MLGEAQSLQNLVKLASEKSPEKRRVLLEEISEMFISDAADVSDRESELMGEIMGKLVHDVEMIVRKNLAEKLADLDDAPRDLLFNLANDEIEVATPILSRSGVLDDSDLIEVVRHCSQEHMMAVARREAVSEQVSDALVDRGSEDVIETLINNHNAIISRRAMSYLAAESERNKGLQKPLLARPDLPGDLAYEMFDWVSQALRQHILQSYQLDESILEGVLEATKNAFIESAPDAGASEAEKLVHRLESTGQLTENFLVQTLRDGRIDVFLCALARKSGLDTRASRRAFFDRGAEGLAIVCKASGFDRSTFASLLLLRHKAEEGSKVMAASAVEQMLSMYTALSESHAKRVLRFWTIRQREKAEAASSEHAVAGAA